MHYQKQQLLTQILTALKEKRDFALVLIDIVGNPETPTTVFDLILEFINRSRKNIDVRGEIKQFLEAIQREIAIQ